MEAVEAAFGVCGDRLVRRLGEAFHGRRRGRVRTLNELARAGLPLPDGVVLTEDAHQAFLEVSGLLERIRLAASSCRGQQSPAEAAEQIRVRYGFSAAVGAELKDQICQALIALGAPVVIVLSDDYEKGGLKTIPDVLGAVQEAWLSGRGLKWQIQNAAVGEEIPTWPVLIQRQISPLYTGWSATSMVVVPAVGGGAREANEHQPTKKTVALYDVEPVVVGEGAVPEGKGIARLTLQAASVLGMNTKIWWGLEGGWWYLLSTERAEDQEPLERCL